MKKLDIPPTLVLFLLAPAMGELLSGSSPPLEFFNPFAFFFMASLYGSGAIIVRELNSVEEGFQGTSAAGSCLRNP